MCDMTPANIINTLPTEIKSLLFKETMALINTSSYDLYQQTIASCKMPQFDIYDDHIHAMWLWQKFEHERKRFHFTFRPNGLTGSWVYKAREIKFTRHPPAKAWRQKMAWWEINEEMRDYEQMTSDALYALAHPWAERKEHVDRYMEKQIEKQCEHPHGSDFWDYTESLIFKLREYRDDRY